MFNKRLSFLLVVFVLIFACKTQKIRVPLVELDQAEKEHFLDAENKLKVHGFLILNGDNDSVKSANNVSFTSELKKILTQPRSFYYAFDSLTTISILTSPDKRCRLFTWNIPWSNGTYSYTGLVQIFDQNKKQHHLVELKAFDATNSKKSLEDITLPKNQWLPFHYYKLVSINKSKDYILLGWDGATQQTNRKIIETFQLTNRGEIIFGIPIINIDGKYKKRLIFAYAQSAVMSLKYHEDIKTIIFDHLSSATGIDDKRYEHYGPDFSFDALKYKKGKWIYMPDYDARNNDPVVQPKKKVKKQDLYRPQ